MSDVSRKRKRTSTDSVDKRFRDSGIDSSYAESQDMFLTAGTIKSVELINFMCHKHLVIDLPHGVNFIIGRNGTGKSAILSALVVGLGGRASDTNRGYSLKEFIRTDEHSAVIKIVINNEGFNAYEPQVFGKHITVQRTIGPTSSQYKIMSSYGTVLPSKHEDLMRMLLYLNLQVDNPVALLTQDTARNFLHNTKPSDKYAFFIKATRLEHILAVYKKVSEAFVINRSFQDDMCKRLAKLKEEKSDIEKRLKRLLSVEQTRDKLEADEDELFWAKVKEQELKLEKLEGARTEQENTFARIEEEMSLIDKKVKTIAENKKTLETMSETLVEEGKVCNTKCGDLKSACEKVNNSRKLKLDEISSRKDERNRLRKNMESINKQIAELQAALDSESSQSKEVIEKNLKILDDERKEIEAKFKTHRHDLNQLEAALQNDVESLQSLDQELAGINFKISQIQTTLKSLEGKEEGTLRLFGPHVMALNREIKAAFDKGMFSKMPRGPIGSYIKVKDKSWAPAVESIIGGDILRSYVVNNHQDRKVLYSLINKVTGGAGGPTPTVTATKFMDKVYNYERNAVHCPGYSSVINMLEVSDFVVINCLIDLLSIETTLLVECPRAAREMMQDVKNVPVNCKKVVTKAGDTYYPDPNYRCYSGDDRTEAKFLRVSVDDAKQGMLTEISNCKKWAENTTSQKAEVSKRIKLHRAEIQAAKKVLDQLSSRKLSIKQEIMDLQQSDPVDANQINFWIAEKKGMNQDLVKTEEILNQLNLECEEIEECYKKMVGEYNILKEESKNKSREIDSVVSKCHQLDNKLIKAKLALDGGVKKKLESQKILKQVEHNVSEQRKIVKKYVTDALQLTKERIESTRPIPEIQEEMKDLKNEIARVEQSEGNPKVLGEKFTDLKILCDNLAGLINETNEVIMKLKAMIRHRKTIYSKCLQLLVTRMQIVFQSLIDRHRYQGGIEIDHIERKLDIRVTLRNPPSQSANSGSKRMADTGDPKSLSGGERSFTTVAFILSLWDAVELPFYALDEFDVYMDNANREITLDLLKNHAEEKKSFQFVFLTPQPVNPGIQSDRVHVFSLESHEAQRRTIS